MRSASVRARLEAWETEGGDTWFIVGHHSDAAAIRAVRGATRGYWAKGEVRNADFCVTRGWWRDAHDPDNDELWIRCEEADADAGPFTLVEL